MHITDNISDHKAHQGDTFDIEGVRYIAVHSFSCGGCAFEVFAEHCGSAPKCSTNDVNFIKKV